MACNRKKTQSWTHTTSRYYILQLQLYVYNTYVFILLFIIIAIAIKVICMSSIYLTKKEKKNTFKLFTKQNKVKRLICDKNEIWTILTINSKLMKCRKEFIHYIEAIKEFAKQLIKLKIDIFTHMQKWFW